MTNKYKYKKGYKIGSVLLDENKKVILDSDLVKKEMKRLFRLSKPKRFEAGDRVELSTYIKIRDIVEHDELFGATNG